MSINLYFKIRINHILPRKQKSRHKASSERANPIVLARDDSSLEMARSGWVWQI